MVAVTPSGPAAIAGLAVGDELVSLNGVAPRDVLEYRRLVDEPQVEIEVDRGGLQFNIEIDKAAGAPLGLEVHSALFDQVRTCDNHCEFCFIYQLPPGMRSSLYLKDDDYRLSFLYGNFTTLTRFTEADFERVITEGCRRCSSASTPPIPNCAPRCCATGGGPRACAGCACCWTPAWRSTARSSCVRASTMAYGWRTPSAVFSSLQRPASLCVVPLGVSRHAAAGRMRPHTLAEAKAVLEAVGAWQETYRSALGRRMVFAADEYYLLTGRELPPATDYEGFEMHEDGVGIARNFVEEFMGRSTEPTGPQAGFFSWVDGAPAAGYRAPHLGCTASGAPPEAHGTPTPSGSGATTVVAAAPVTLRRRRASAVLTGELGAAVLGPMLADAGYDDIGLITVENRFFGGNIGVTGLMVGADVARVLADQPPDGRYLLPDVCLSGGRFLDGLTTAGPAAPCRGCEDRRHRPQASTGRPVTP